MQFDQWEFDPPDSEEFLDLAISQRSRDIPHPTIESFLSDCGASKLVGAQGIPQWNRAGIVASHLRQFAGIEIEAGTVFLLLNEEWDDLEVAIESGDTFVWYHWRTTS